MPAKKSVDKVLARLTGEKSTIKSFRAPSGLGLQIDMPYPERSIDPLTEVHMTDRDGHNIRMSLSSILQGAAILSRITKANVCIFHGVFKGGNFGCESCRNETVESVAVARQRGSVVDEANE